MALEEQITELTTAIIALTDLLREKSEVEVEPEKPKRKPRTSAKKGTSTRKPRAKKEPEPEPEPEDNGDIDLPAIRKLFRNLVQAAGRDAAAEILSEFDAKKVPDLEASDYAEVADRIEEAIAEAEETD